ncbi:hypothetical protein HLB23_24575 [Nocardia uniformis]|uniref:Uncharacterized protein n=1 Tax=Nocardia uniformis TaxID=53432 RepID=A0A849CAM4_9NOCA|nr:hypothetical protein [Nocardia uniformis]NNH72997.1 hypothetical protein [Nocardia uniformis]
MNEHDEIDQARREFGMLAGKVKDATVTAGRWNQARLQNAERVHDRAERAHDRAEQRSERAIRMAERAQRLLRTHWKQVDRDATADLAVELETARATRAEQEHLVAQWAWAQAHADENPEVAAGLDARVRDEIGIDPEILRNPIANDPTQPFIPVHATPPVTEADPAAATDTGPGTGDLTSLDQAAVIQGLIDAAHPDQSSVETDAPLSSQVIETPSAGVDQQLISPDLETDVSGGDVV